MPTSVRAQQARLLADSRGVEPRARLAQAVSRADFLLRLSRTLSAVQNPQRAIEAVVDLLLDEMVEVAHLVVHTGPWQLACGGVHGAPTHSVVDRWVDQDSETVRSALARGIPDQVALPSTTVERAAVLRRHLTPGALADEAAALGCEQLMLLPLSARGRTFGLLALGRTLGFGDVATFLEDLTARIATGLDAALLLAESRHVTAVLRDSLAPADLPEPAHLDLATYTRVAHQSEELGGDLLDVHGADDDLTLVCGDVTGKGVEAAVHAKRIRNAVRTLAQVDRDPGWILGLVNRVLVDEAGPFSESLSTAVCVRLRTEPSDGPGDATSDGPDDGSEPEATLSGDRRLLVDLASAGHPPAMVLRTDGRVEEIATTGVSLALVDDAAYDLTRVVLRDGDLLLLYTDGVTEARGAEDLFGEDGLRRTLAGLCGLRASAVVEALAVTVSDHLGDRAHDDIAVLAVQYRPAEAS
jgi:hypothetical protein